jgi:RNA polymerase sigma-70 factor (ECF subfamily)
LRPCETSHTTPGKRSRLSRRDAVNSSDEDRVLISKACKGDDLAFSKLTRKYRDAGMRYCYRFLGDYQLAEDVVQEGFINLFNSLDRYRETGRFSTFFFKILTNLCIDTIRRRSKQMPQGSSRGEISICNLKEIIPEKREDSPCDRLISREKASRLRLLINRLPPPQRKAVLLRDLKGYKYCEISRKMNCTMNRVKILIFRGRRNLQRILRTAAL